MPIIRGKKIRVVLISFIILALPAARAFGYIFFILTVKKDAASIANARNYTREIVVAYKI